MIDISEINDSESLEQWLTDLTFDAAENRRIAVTIAHRAAMRVLPVYWEWVNRDAKARKIDLTALPILRCNLISGVAALTPTPEIRNAASYAAASASYAAAAAAAYAASASSSASSSAAASAAASSSAAASAAASSSAAASAAASAASSSALWDEIQTDCAALQQGNETLLDAAPLWSGENPLADKWQSTLKTLPEGWNFWRDWYQNALDGVPPNWDKLTKIALIDPDDWDQGPEHVSGLIAEIERGFLPVKEPKVSVKTVQKTVAKNLDAIPPQIEAIILQLDTEIELLRVKNLKDDLEMAERDRQVAILTNMKAAAVSLEELVPTSGEPSLDDTEEMISLWQVYKSEYQKWPRENAADLVDSSCRVVLIGLTAGLSISFGLPILAGVAIGGVAFGGKKLAGVAKTVKDNLAEKRRNTALTKGQSLIAGGCEAPAHWGGRALPGDAGRAVEAVYLFSPTLTQSLPSCYEICRFTFLWQCATPPI